MNRVHQIQRLLLASAMMLLLLPAGPVLAAPLGGHLSAGIGGGFGDNDVGPFVLSGKYWTRSWEVGAEVFYDGNTQNTIDQFGLIWAMYRFDLHPEERNYLYTGLGPGELISSSSFKNTTGAILTLGWDGKDYGLQFKYGYFTPSIYSVVAYYHF